MPFWAGMVGATMGVGVRVLANVASKDRALYRPWNHLAMFIIGFWVGSKYPEFSRSIDEKNYAMKLLREEKPEDYPRITNTNQNEF